MVTSRIKQATHVSYLWNMSQSNNMESCGLCTCSRSSNIDKYDVKTEDINPCEMCKAMPRCQEEPGRLAPGRVLSLYRSHRGGHYAKVDAYVRALKDSWCYREDMAGCWNMVWRWH